MTRTPVVAVALVLPLAVGCLSGGEGPPVYDGNCSVFDPEPPAATARLDREAADPRLPVSGEVRFTLTDEQGATLEVWRFPMDDCIGVGLPSSGLYTFKAEAEHPEEACRFVDEDERRFAEDGYADVRLAPTAVCG